ncbi:hypothetical protein [Hymenobacter ruber]
MSTKPAYTHTVRVKGSDATPEHATDADIEAMKKGFGERTFKTKYEVVKLAEKPADLPTTAEKPAKAEKAEDKK